MSSTPRAQAQETAGDYAAAWESFSQAAMVAETDGFFAKLLGGLGERRQKIRTAQEDLAMEWLRESRAPEGHTFSEVTDKLVNTLVVGANTASGARKADLLAHLGWAYFLKMRSGENGLQPEKLYEQAVTADATNPYANVFWGHWILWNHGSTGKGQRALQPRRCLRTAHAKRCGTSSSRRSRMRARMRTVRG